MTSLRLRPAELHDAPAIAAVYAPYVTDTAISFEATPPDGDEIATRMTANPRLPWWVAVEGELRDGAVGGDIREEVAGRVDNPVDGAVDDAVDDGAVIGYAYASPHRSRAAYRWSVEVSIYLARSHQGRGAGAVLYRQLLADVRELGYVSAYAGITLPNPASVRLHERAGFVPIGTFPAVGYKHGRWHDVGWWYLPLVDRPDSPAEPRPWGRRQRGRRLST